MWSSLHPMWVADIPKPVRFWFFGCLVYVKTAIESAKFISSEPTSFLHRLVNLDRLVNLKILESRTFPFTLMDRSYDRFLCTYPHVFGHAIWDSISSQFAIAQCCPLSTQFSLHSPQRFGHISRPIGVEQSPLAVVQRASFLFWQLISLPYLNQVI